MFGKIMDFLSSLLGIIRQLLTGRNEEARRKDREDIRQNESAKKEVELRDQAEKAVKNVEQAKTEEEKQKALDEIRKKISA